QPVVNACRVVELERPTLLAYGRQLEARVQIDGEGAEVAGHDRPELELEVRFRVVRQLRLEVPAQIDRIAALVPEGAAGPEAHARVLDVLGVRALDVDVGRDVDLVGHAVVVLEARPHEPVARRFTLLALSRTSIPDEGR